MPDQFVRKFTTNLCWLRPVTEETPICRVMAKIFGGRERVSTFGAFVQWDGQIMVQSVQNPGPMIATAPKGIVRTLVTRDMILPAVASDWLASYMQREDKGRPSDPTATETGVTFKPAGDLADIRCVIDLSIRPPSSSKPSQTGYEFAVSIAQADPRHDPMAGLLADLGEFAPFRPLQGLVTAAGQTAGPAGEGATAQPEAAEAAD
jgi:hypothetical protein